MQSSLERHGFLADFLMAYIIHNSHVIKKRADLAHWGPYNATAIIMGASSLGVMVMSAH